ncbi:Uncharacterised protein [Raoultella terrigena]|uniref:Uncharacterized protein n=1 Tax=Raoultella terrigena TaxID=577 RepID=A0A4U9D3N1_RAOTE|nr:Uncharacterised protein [Raoultella terrigena]
MNFQEIHGYYSTLGIDSYLDEIIHEGEDVLLPANKKLEVKAGYIYFVLVVLYQY